ncbi:MAG: hypothetical protein KIT26_04855 [Nitrosomonas sp.]|nr:hypothetical protein [Nitrosomonas sp.]
MTGVIKNKPAQCIDRPALSQRKVLMRMRQIVTFSNAAPDLSAYIREQEKEDEHYDHGAGYRHAALAANNSPFDGLNQ